MNCHKFLSIYAENTVLRKKAPEISFRSLCGERGIRTPGTSQYAGFQDRCIRPLCHLSIGCYERCFKSVCNILLLVKTDTMRRERDSNPRYLSVRRFSRPVHSTTLPSLHRVLWLACSRSCQNKSVLPFCFLRVQR